MAADAVAFALLGQVSVRRVVAYIFCAQEGLCSTFLQAPVRTASEQYSALRCAAWGAFLPQKTAVHYTTAIVVTIVIVVARRPGPIAIRASESSVFHNQWLACLRVVCVHYI